MKKFLSLALCVLMLAGCLSLFACGSKTYEIAVVTDVGQLMDKGFNQGTYEGAKKYAEDNGKTYKYYQPANGSNATDEDRIAAMKQAINNGAKIIVTPGFLQETAITTVAKENPDVKFVFIDGWDLGLANVIGVSYKEQESGYLAGYAAVMEGYTKLGFTGGGGGSNPACNRYGFGFVQGAAAAAKAQGKDITVKFSFQNGSTFSASDALQSQIAGWYQNGTEVVFSCGGSMFDSVVAAANTFENAKIVGVDVDQSSQSDRVITSAVKGLSASVEYILGQIYADKWAEMGNSANLGAADDATGLPTDTFTQTLKKWTLDEYNALYAQIKNGTLVPASETPADANSGDWLNTWLSQNNYTNVTIDFE
ncbi:MAG: BMP family ABC transporter substrate-binding protein [Clostridia bacterium]|nr:BMP family ABC transporter substrate-binding protein [Clostridia bacterium]